MKFVCLYFFDKQVFRMAFRFIFSGDFSGVLIKSKTHLSGQHLADPSQIFRWDENI